MNIGKMIKSLAPVIAIATIFIIGYFYYQHQKNFPNTDDAYVQANIVYIAAQVTGDVAVVYVKDQQHVKQGDPLFDINPTPFKIALEQAKAQLQDTKQQIQAAQSDLLSAQSLVAQRQAELMLSQKSYHRTMTLVKAHLYPLANGDQATSDLKVAQAALVSARTQLLEAQQKLGDPGQSNVRIQEAMAAVSQAELNLRYTHVTAPSDGDIINFTLQNGSQVTAYQDLFALVESNEWWLSANFKETQLDRIRPGMPVNVVLDMYPHKIFTGVVESISAGSGESFSLLPPENATGNWVKVTQRFPVRIALKNDDSNYPLRVGASCTATINTTHFP